MRIAIATAQGLFVRGGAELLAETLAAKLRERAHETEIVRLPLSIRSPEAVFDSMAAARLTSLADFDRVIALKFPAYLVEHDEKVVWLLHQLRQAYDLWGTPLGFQPTSQGVALRRAIVEADTACLSEAMRIFTNSRTTQRRLARFNGLSAEVLYPPQLEDTEVTAGEYGDYLFYPSRINEIKRQWLAIEALPHTRTDVRLVLAGPPEGRESLERVSGLAADLGLENRVTVYSEWISEERKRDLLANALGCIYLPLDEDSYGFVSLEAFQARKPVITCTDSGGTLEIVLPDETGEVVPPEPAAIAEVMDRLFLDRRRASRLGNAGHALVDKLGLSWETVVDRLTS